MLACWEHQRKEKIESLPTALRKYLYKYVIEKAEAFKQQAEYFIANNLDLDQFVLMDTITARHQQPEIGLPHEAFAGPV